MEKFSSHYFVCYLPLFYLSEYKTGEFMWYNVANRNGKKSKAFAASMMSKIPLRVLTTHTHSHAEQRMKLSKNWGKNFYDQMKLGREEKKLYPHLKNWKKEGKVDRSVVYI